jgi:hypothetical protein
VQESALEIERLAQENKKLRYDMANVHKETTRLVQLLTPKKPSWCEPKKEPII